MTRVAFIRTTARWCAVVFAAVAGWSATVCAARVSDRPEPFTRPFAHSEHGPLRVLVLGGTAIGLHRTQAIEFAMLGDYARREGRELEWIPLYRPDDVYGKLVRGEGDIAVGTLPNELATRPTIATTEPLSTTRYQLLGRNELTARNPLELAGLRLGIRLSSPLWSYFEKLQAVVPDLQLDALPSDLPRDEALRLVADGVYDATVLPVTDEGEGLSSYPRLKRLFDLTDGEPVGWYVRSDGRDLLLSLNRFIEQYHTAYFEPVPAPRNFAAIKERGILRVITRVDPQNYTIVGGRPSGYEYELARAFAAAHDLTVQVLVADDDRQMVRWLLDGAGDLIASRIDANLVRGNPGLRFSRQFHHTAYAVVSRREAPVTRMDELRTKRVVAVDGTPEWRALRSARANVRGLQPIPAVRSMSRTRLLARLARGDIDATIIDGDSVAGVLAKAPGLTAGVSVPHAYNYRWLVRGGDTDLLAAVNDFLRESRSDGLDAIMVARYFGKDDAPQLADTQRPRISPFDDLLQRYANRYGFDWRLLAAQAYQESQFNPRAVSRSGARGLMQILPETARTLGVANLVEPESAIRAGVQYLYRLREEFDAEVPVSERTWFALAAYNTGAGRVERARQLAAKLDLDPNRWFGNVETAMLKLARGTRSGGLARRYGQAIIYVREIQSLYAMYRHLRTQETPSAISDLPLTDSGIAGADTLLAFNH